MMGPIGQDLILGSFIIQKEKLSLFVGRLAQINRAEIGTNLHSKEMLPHKLGGILSSTRKKVPEFNISGSQNV